MQIFLKFKAGGHGRNGPMVNTPLLIVPPFPSLLSSH